MCHLLGNRDSFNDEFGLHFTPDTVFNLFDSLEIDDQRLMFSYHLSTVLNGVYERYREDGYEGRYSVLPSTFRGEPVYVLVNVDDRISNVVGILSLRKSQFNTSWIGS